MSHENSKAHNSQVGLNLSVSNWKSWKGFGGGRRNESTRPMFYSWSSGSTVGRGANGRVSGQRREKSKGSFHSEDIIQEGSGSGN